MRSVISLGAVLGLLFSCAVVGAGAEDRIEVPVGDGTLVVLANSVHPAVSRANDRGRMEPNVRISEITVMLTPSDAQRAALETLLEAQRDPASPDYRRWLTPEEFGDRFGLSDNDFAAVRSWLEAGGLAIEQVARARNWIVFSGTASDIEQAFHVELHRLDVDGAAHFANTGDIQIPATLAGVVAGVRGLDDFRPKPLHTGIVPKPELDAAGGVHYLAPGDFATIYDIQNLYSAGYDGAGQKLAIAGQTDVNLSDLRAFRAQFNLSAKDPLLVLTGSDPGSNPGDQTEATLDLEWSGAVAKNATIVYVYSPNVFQSLQYAIDQNLAPVISLSYGGCELQASVTYRTLAQQANAEGITWMTASGDAGPAGCDASGEAQAKNGVSAAFPADIPEVTAVGGTEFNEGTGFYWQAQNNAGLASAVSWIPEKAWNDTALGNGLAAGGGAPSRIYQKPWWQAGAGVPNDQARDIPDVSLAASGAHDAYALYLRGQLVGIGGTSAASPSFAGIVTILNQYLVAKGSISRPGLGNINPALYSLAQNTTGLFHDIVTGSNDVPCAAGSKGCLNGSEGFSAGVGYDLATGLGSVDAYNLVTKWTSVPPVTGTTITLTATPPSIAPTANAQLTATVTSLSGGNAPAGTVSFGVGNTVLGSAALVGSGSTATAAITVKGSSLSTGVNSITAIYQGSATLMNPSATATVAVTAPATAPPIATTTLLTAAPATIAQSGSAVLTATVRPATGATVPTGTVAFMAGTASLGTASLASAATGAVATLTVKGSNLATGANTVTANYSATGNFSSSSGAATVTATGPASATLTTVTATPASIAASAASLLTVTVKPSAGTTIPTGTVSLMLGSSTLGSLPLTNGAVSGLLPGVALSTGPNNIVAVYSGSTAFSASTSAPLMITVTVPVATTTTLAANPATIATTASTVLTATVKAGQGSSYPAGSVLFTVGNTLLGSVILTGSGATATATLNVKGTVLSAGANSITASCVPAGNFGPSTASLTLNVTVPVTATSLTVTAAAGKQASTTVLTVTLKAASGTATPTGAVSFGLGTALLGTAALSGSAGTATGTFTLNNNVLVPGSNNITVLFGGSPGFAGSSASVTVKR
jgi:hypothetical protein